MKILLFSVMFWAFAIAYLAFPWLGALGGLQPTDVVTFGTFAKHFLVGE